MLSTAVIWTGEGVPHRGRIEAGRIDGPDCGVTAGTPPADQMAVAAGCRRLSLL